jgi:hypothetical protein
LTVGCSEVQDAGARGTMLLYPSMRRVGAYFSHPIL